jgi:uncharacterized protein YndB with AHSA1/START domain
MERTYDAPAKVFKAHADTVIKRRWFAEGEGWDIESYTLDFRVGGSEASSFRFQGGDLITFDAPLHDHRHCVACNDAVAGKRISASLATTELRPAGKGTRLVFTEQGAYLDGYDTIAERKKGRAGCSKRSPASLERREGYSERGR